MRMSQATENRPSRALGAVARPLVALVAVLGLVAAGCGVTADPSDDLADAFEDSFDGSFSYALSVEADRAALDALGDGAAQAAGFLDQFSVSGALDGETGTSLGLSISDDIQLFEARTFGEDLYLRLGLDEFLGLGSGSFDPRDELAPALGALGFDEDVQTAVIDALDGEWIAVEGGIDVSSLQGALGGDDAGVDEGRAAVAISEALGEDLSGFFERYLVVEGVDDEGDGIRRYAVELQLRDLLVALGEMNEEAGVVDQPAASDLEADLADLPETVPGTVLTDEGLVTEVRLDLAAPDGESGSVLLILGLGDFDAVEPLEEPSGAVRISQEEFLRVVSTLSSLTGAIPGS